MCMFFTPTWIQPRLRLRCFQWWRFKGRRQMNRSVIYVFKKEGRFLLNFQIYHKSSPLHGNQPVMMEMEPLACHTRPWLIWFPRYHSQEAWNLQKKPAWRHQLEIHSWCVTEKSCIHRKCNVFDSKLNSLTDLPQIYFTVQEAKCSWILKVIQFNGKQNSRSQGQCVTEYTFFTCRGWTARSHSIEPPNPLRSLSGNMVTKIGLTHLEVGFVFLLGKCKHLCLEGQPHENPPLSLTFFRYLCALGTLGDIFNHYLDLHSVTESSEKSQIIPHPC